MAGSGRIMGHIMMSCTLAGLQFTELLRMGKAYIAYHYLLFKYPNRQKQTYEEFIRLDLIPILLIH